MTERSVGRDGLPVEDVPGQPLLITLVTEAWSLLIRFAALNWQFLTFSFLGTDVR